MATITINGSNSDGITDAIDQIMSIIGDRPSNLNYVESNSRSNQQNRNYNEPKSFSNESPQFQEKQDDFVVIDWQAAARESVIIIIILCFILCL